MFESKIINELAFLRNHLNIRGKAKKYPMYDATVKINGEVYKVKAINNATLIGQKKVRSIEGNHLLGPLEDIEKVGKSKDVDKKIEVIDLNNTEIEKGIKINPNILISNEMYRLVCKIAYEWFCKENNITNKQNIFENVINFIVSGKVESNKKIVSIVSDYEIYNELHNHCNHGSHFLCSYVSEDNKIIILVSMFGLAIYKVELCNDYKFEKKVFSEEFMLTGEKKTIDSLDLSNLVSDLMNCSEITKINGVKIRMPKPNKDGVGISDKIFFIKFLNNVNRDEFESSDDVDVLTNILMQNYQELVSSSIIDLNVMKRFISDYKILDGININPKASNKEFWIKLKILYEIGISNVENIDNKYLNKVAQEIIRPINNECIVTDDIIEKIKTNI